MTKAQAQAIVLEMAVLFTDSFPQHEDIDEFKTAINKLEGKK